MTQDEVEKMATKDCEEHWRYYRMIARGTCDHHKITPITDEQMDVVATLLIAAYCRGAIHAQEKGHG